MKVINKKKYCRIIILFIVLIFLSFFVFICLLFHPKILGRNLIEQYGWNVLNPWQVGKHTIVLSNEFLDEELTKMQIEASDNIGLNPVTYEGASVTEYDYTLGQTGINSPLRARIWVYKNKVICAYLFHSESNLKVRYWSFSTTYDRIISDLNELMKDNPSLIK
jgi:hypothetical protein